MERMRQADGDIEKHDAERRHQFYRYRLLAAFARRSLSGSVPDSVPDVPSSAGREPHIGREPEFVLEIVGDDWDNLESQVVRGGLAHHDGTVGLHPRAVARVVDMDSHADPEVSNSECVGVERVTLRPSRPRRSVDDLDLGDEFVAEVGGDGNLVDGNDAAVLVSDLDDDDLHVVSFHFLAANAARLRLEASYVRFSISHETRSQPPKRNIIIPLLTNQDLISCLHLLVNNTLSDKDLLNSSTKADIYIISEC